MKRFAGVACLWLVGTLSAGAAAAQTPTTGSAAPDRKIYAEFNTGPTLGHKSDVFFGAEGGMRLPWYGLDVFIEAGQMKNVGTSALDANAALIAACCIPGATVSTGIKVNYVNFGVRYHLTIYPQWHPYVLAGVGSAGVKTEASFAVNGSVVDPNAFGVQLGGDLSGSTRKAMLIIGTGVNIPFMQRYYADIGYRYGGIFAKTGDVETDKSLKTQRIVLGIGVRF